MITITLLALLVLLLVSLASLTRVETQVAANGMQSAQARANALFALNLAMGQLQKYAGPDQAVTARADIDSANTGNPVWTGVWDARPPVPATPTHAAAPASSVPMAWLVSGNETNGTALTPVTAAVADPATGNDNVWLVHKVFGQDLAAQLPDYPLDGRVKLKKTPIEVPANQLPGFSAASTTATPVGAYAWWVGDEGIKAKVNLADPYRSAGVTDEETAWRRLAPPRPGLEMLDATKASELQATFTATTDVFETKRAGLLDYQQLPMLNANLATTTGAAQAGRYFNDLTTVGYGVLADTMRGGLRRDLTRGLAAIPTAGSTAASEIGDGLAVFTLPLPGPYGRTTKAPVTSVWTPNAEPHAPTWSEVRAWFNIRADGNNAVIDPVSAPLVTVTRNGITCPTATGHAIMPVVAMLELGYGMDVDTDGKYRIMIRPRVVLMNPYNVALRTAAYSVIYQSFVGSNSDLTFTMALDAANSDSPAYFLSSGTGLINPNPVTGVRQLSFNITDNFGPGEVRVYSLPASATSDIQVNDGVFDLKPGLSTNRAYLATNTPAPAWYDASKRNLINVTWAKIPADHPRISIALGSTTTSAAPAPSIIDRYIETSSSALYGLSGGKPNPVAKLDTDAARQMRTVRFTLRHAELDMLGYGTTASDTDVPGGSAADTTSGARFLVDGNPRAIVSQRLGGWDNVANYAVTPLKGSEYTDIDYEEAGGTTLGFWGGSSTVSNGTTHAILFDVLRRNEEVVSLGRLGQVNWGVDAKHPAYPLGNSFASIFYNHNEPDYSYALNEALWDRFFFSTLPVSLTTRPVNLPDSRLRFHDPAGASTALTTLEGVNGYQLAATRLMIDGAFNVNSTSVEAWAAFLGSVQAADYAYQSSAGARTDTAVRAFPRTISMHDPDPTTQSGNMYEWTGYRQLDAAQLKSLATQIVTGIKARARPARSLAEFMNRDLSQLASSVRNQEGIVQAAINAVVNTDTPDESGNGTGLINLSGLNTSKIVPSSFDNGDNPDAARGKLRSIGAPGFLMQSDLLTPLVPAMSARSDTFRVRTYGETRNPVTGDISGRAWCEAVVQRMTEFVGGEAAELKLDDPTLGTNSKTFGRKFVIVQFRWLGPDEI
ncbi:MAG: hypothetical protein WC205_09060 [Opitutaceae bacterium]